MPTIRLHLTLTILFLSSLILIFDWIARSNTPIYSIYTVYFPVDKNNPTVYSKRLIDDELIGKYKIQITEDNIENEKKIEVIKYEARKLKYTNDTNKVLEIEITKGVSYKYIIQLFSICFSDHHKRFAMVENRFIIWGGN
jgi:hypothetical protein